MLYIMRANSYIYVCCPWQHFHKRIRQVISEIITFTIYTSANQWSTNFSKAKFQGLVIVHVYFCNLLIISSFHIFCNASWNFVPDRTAMGQRPKTARALQFNNNCKRILSMCRKTKGHARVYCSGLSEFQDMFCVFQLIIDSKLCYSNSFHYLNIIEECRNNH